VDPSFGVATLAVIGGIAGGAGDLIGQAYTIHGTCKSINWGATAGSVIVGAFSGYAGVATAELGSMGIGEWAYTSAGALAGSGPSLGLWLEGGWIWDSYH
jgi:hypothetical protein